VKVWIYKGDVVGGRRESLLNARDERNSRGGARRERPRRGGARRQRADQKQEG
jgi:small subunit ribosomal protein S3